MPNSDQKDKIPAEEMPGTGASVMRSCTVRDGSGNKRHIAVTTGGTGEFRRKELSFYMPHSTAIKMGWGHR